MLLLRRSCFFRPESRVIPDYTSWADSRNPSICYLEKMPISPKISLLFRHNVAIKTRVIPHLCRHRCIFNKASRNNSSPSPLRGQNEQESLGKWGWWEREEGGGGGRGGDRLREDDWSTRKENHLIFQKGWHFCP